jgi:hypothetical protein
MTAPLNGYTLSDAHPTERSAQARSRKTHVHHKSAGTGLPYHHSHALTTAVPIRGGGAGGQVAPAEKEAAEQEQTRLAPTNPPASIDHPPHLLPLDSGSSTGMPRVSLSHPLGRIRGALLCQPHKYRPTSASRLGRQTFDPWSTQCLTGTNKQADTKVVLRKRRRQEDVGRARV